MGILITTESLNQQKACPEAYAFFTGSFCVKGNQWYSGSNNEAYFEKGIIYNFTCSNSSEVSWLIWASNRFNITGSFYNKETNTSQYYYKTTIDIPISGSK